MRKIVGNNIKGLVLLAIMVLPMALFGADDDFIVPFKNLITTWMQGSVGLTIAIVVNVISILWGAFGGGFGVIGKGFLISILVGGVMFIAESGFNLGTGFSA